MDWSPQVGPRPCPAATAQSLDHAGPEEAPALAGRRLGIAEPHRAIRRRGHDAELGPRLEIGADFESVAPARLAPQVPLVGPTAGEQREFARHGGQLDDLAAPGEIHQVAVKGAAARERHAALLVRGHADLVGQLARLLVEERAPLHAGILLVEHAAGPDGDDLPARRREVLHRVGAQAGKHGHVVGDRDDRSGQVGLRCVGGDDHEGIHTVGFGGAGAVYRLDGSTGATTLVLQLPQQLDPALPVGEQYAGLGQLSYDPSTQRHFASNFEDGRVYAIDPSNGAGFKVRSTFRHGGAITGQLPDANLADPTDSAGFEPLGKRIWAVKATRGRLYYSLWVEDSARPDAAQANQVWSVAYNAGGEFIAGSERKEFDVPPRVGSNYSNPIADITFDGNCCMLVAERSMSGDSSTGAHDARTMRFCQDKSGAWQLDTVLLTGAFGSGENSAGGIGYEGTADQVWSMGDAIRLDSVAIYGLQGQAAAGAPVANSILVDLDGSISQGQKTQLGSIDVNCLFIRDCEFDTIDIDCKPQADGSMDFLWTVSITNNSPSVANILILSDPAFAPNNVILLDAPVAPGNKIVLDIPINGGTPGEQFCFFATLASSTGNECCTEEICIELPDCECFDSDVAVRDLPGNGSFEVNLSITNLEPFAAEWITVAVSPAGAGSVNPSLVNIPTTPQFTTVATGPLTINTTAAPGTPLTLIVGMHAQTFHPCCFVEIVVVVPANAGNQVPGDMDGDGAVNATDLAILFNNWGGAGATDLNGDGVTNGQDLAILLSNWG